MTTFALDATAMRWAASGDPLIMCASDGTWEAADAAVFGHDDAHDAMSAAEVLADQLACGAILPERALELADGLVVGDLDEDDGPIRAPRGSNLARSIARSAGDVLDRLKAGELSDAKALELSETLSYDAWPGSDEAA